MKTKYYIALLALLIAGNAFSQDSLLTRGTMRSLNPAVYTRDTLLKSAPIHQIDEAKDSVIASTDAAKEAIKSPAKNYSKPYQSKRVVDIFKSIDFITILEALLLIFITFTIFRLLNRSNKSAFARRFPFYASRFVPALKAITIILAIYLLINLTFGVSKEILLAFLIIIVITLAVASVPVVKNLIGGFLLTYNPPFEKGDIIHVGNFTGKVTDINWRHTIIVTDNGSNVSLPNSLFLNNPVENINIGNREQLITLEIELPSSIEHDYIINVLKEASLSNPYLYTRKKAEVFLKKFDALKNTYTYEVNFYIFDRQFYEETLNHFNQIVANKLNTVN
ncbi:mechanosensitive ion channel family protein [Melioribacter sp. Ez-97]|uniref:mechanosensitive ion channel family protein n=1 Tax=Melioribacter sp. Ez-97 TaxID=3423434 RepID=UPI003EDAC067